MINILDLENNISMHVRDAVADVAISGTAELIGRIVQQLVRANLLSATDLRAILPNRYEVRE
jgi:hypothetical protein